jgi:hypothetical protein
VRINEELLERKVTAPVYKTEINDLGDPPLRPRDTPLSTKVGTKISSTSGGRSVGIVRLRTKGHGDCFCFDFIFIKSVIQIRNKSSPVTIEQRLA